MRRKTHTYDSNKRQYNFNMQLRSGTVLQGPSVEHTSKPEKQENADIFHPALSCVDRERIAKELSFMGFSENAVCIALMHHMDMESAIQWLCDNPQVNDEPIPTPTNSEGHVSFPNPAQVMKKKKVRRHPVKSKHQRNDDIHDIIITLGLYITEIKEIDDSKCDPLMEKIRIITEEYSYLNSQPIRAIMHPRFRPFRITMVERCALLSHKAKVKINERIRVASEIMSECDAKQYYMPHLVKMKRELDKFTRTYAATV